MFRYAKANRSSNQQASETSMPGPPQGRRAARRPSTWPEGQTKIGKAEKSLEKAKMWCVNA